MKTNKVRACEVTGFVLKHATACDTVASQLNSIILFREPGVMARGLIEENYCMKGFRIDTKSCNWGPMSGFVCVDPRLTKDSIYEARNANWTMEAVSGHIVERFFGDVKDATWIADVMPIVISNARIAELTAQGVIAHRVDQGHLVGESTATKGDTILPWRLVPVGNATNNWLRVDNEIPSGYNVLCVNTSGRTSFRQRYPKGVEPIMFRGHETILGLINPGTKSRGFKACVTADYDLFSIWPKVPVRDLMGIGHAINGQLLTVRGHPDAVSLPGGIARMPAIDDRLQHQRHPEHYRFGNVSARVMLVKTMLNSALMGMAGYKGGNAIHHNDEAGNFALAKGTLADCLPLIGFMPTHGTVLIETLLDFKELVIFATGADFVPLAKPQWLLEAGIV
jgi:hypothetical protein